MQWNEYQSQQGNNMTQEQHATHVAMVSILQAAAYVRDLKRQHAKELSEYKIAGKRSRAAAQHWYRRAKALQHMIADEHEQAEEDWLGPMEKVNLRQRIA